MLRFTLRELLLVIAVMSLAMMWWNDHTALIETKVDAEILARIGRPPEIFCCGTPALSWISVADKYRKPHDDADPRGFDLVNSEISD